MLPDEYMIPDCVGVTPDAETSRFRLELVGAFVFFDGCAGAAFFHVHALAAVRRDRVAADPVASAAVFSVCPLKQNTSALTRRGNIVPARTDMSTKTETLRRHASYGGVSR